MRTRTWLFTMFAVLLPVVAWLLLRPIPGNTRLTLVNPDTGHRLASFVLADEEQISITWRNSLFGLDVTESFVARNGLLIQTEVTFALPDGSPPPSVRPQDVDDLYHTGGAFSAKGLSRPLQQIIYRVSEIGNPKMRIRDHVIDFKSVVGFGGRVVLTARAPAPYDLITAAL